MPDYAAFAAELIAHPPRPGRRIVDDAKVHDHHAIIPTGKPVRPGALDRDERRLFDLIARRFLAAFHPDAEFAVTEVWIRVGAPGASAPPPAEPAEAPARDAGSAGSARSPDSGEGDVPVLDALPPRPDRYFARGRVRLVAGWQAVAGIDATAAARGAAVPPGTDARPDRAAEARAEADADPPQPLPPLAEGQPLDGAFAPIARQTTPPRRYTEATLLGAMESAGKTIDDEALRLAMKDCGLGTPATRAAIIETLLARDYAVRARQDLVPTPRGIALIDALPVASLASPELTGAWEARLARIARGQDSRAAFMADIARYVADTVDAIRGASPPAAPSTPSSGAPSTGDGPRRWQRRRGERGAARRRTKGARGAGAGGARRGTGRGRSAERSADRSADRPVDRSADRSVERSAARGAPGRRRAPAASASSRPPAAIPALSCPRCGVGTLITGARGWGCARWRDGCRFVIWFETAGRRLTPAQLRDLVIRGKTRKARFRSGHGTECDGRLVLDPSADGGARLEPA